MNEKGLKRLKLITFIAIPLISLAMHFPHFGKDLMSVHTWRQTYTQANIDNFYEEDFNILNPRKDFRLNGDGIFRMEFPLMQWTVAALYKIFGQHLWITRAFIFIVGLFTVWGIYRLLLATSGKVLLALMGAWTFNFSPSFFYYTINPLPDLFALGLAVWGLAFFFDWIRKEKHYLWLFSGALMSLAAFCKLPFVIFFSVPGVYFLTCLLQKDKRKFLLRLCLLLCFAPLPLAWYLPVIGAWRTNGVVSGPFDNPVDTETYLTYIKNNVISVLPESLLNYGAVLFFLAGIIFIFKHKRFKHRQFWMWAIWGMVTLAYFFYELNVIGSAHDYYLFPFFPLLFMLVALGAYSLYQMKFRWIKIAVILILLMLPLTAWLRMRVRWDPDSPGFNKDLLVYKEELRNAVPDDALCIVGNDPSGSILFHYIHKKGWAFERDSLSLWKVGEIIPLGAAYLYSDTRKFEERTDVAPYLDSLILEKGSIRVYRLSLPD